ncbi:hypothetical protein B0H34DRAFT_675744 [Crassisporium funariophilum]|nr:hypothetical protein B0H34DRAFT_675744 [Crassisporium funariophilum]
MFSKIWSTSALVLALCLQAHAHAAVSPVLGVSGTPVRGNVERPSTANPCGSGVNIASELDSSTAVAASAAGVVNAVAINFNGGADGSRKVTAKVDATGKGTNFVAMTVTTNGDAAPASVGSQPIVASLPAGTKCTGGANGNLCLVQFTTSAGFGNCVAVSQGAAAAAGGATAAGNTAATGTATTAPATGAGAGGAAAGGAAAGTAKKTKAAGGAAGAGAAAKKAKAAGTTKKAKAAGGAAAGTARKGKVAAGAAAKANGTAAGTRAARTLLADLEIRGGEAVNVARRSIASWIWA